MPVAIGQSACNTGIYQESTFLVAACITFLLTTTGYHYTAATLNETKLVALSGHVDEQQPFTFHSTDIERVTSAQYGRSSACGRIRIVSRSEWLAKNPLTKLELRTRPAERAIIHQAWDGRSCNDLDSCTVRMQAIQAYHQYSKSWPDVSYNFLISGDGTIYEGTGFTAIGFHTLNYNEDSLGIALIGTFQDVPPTSRMESALSLLLDCAHQLGHLIPTYSVHGHRDARCTICPGDAAYSRLTKLARFRAGPLARYSCPVGGAMRPNSDTGSSSAGCSLTAMSSSAREREQQQVVKLESLNKRFSLVLPSTQVLKVAAHAPSKVVPDDDATTTTATTTHDGQYNSAQTHTSSGLPHSASQTGEASTWALLAALVSRRRNSAEILNSKQVNEQMNNDIKSNNNENEQQAVTMATRSRKQQQQARSTIKPNERQIILVKTTGNRRETEPQPFEPVVYVFTKERANKPAKLIYTEQTSPESSRGHVSGEIQDKVNGQRQQQQRHKDGEEIEGERKEQMDQKRLPEDQVTDNNSATQIKLGFLLQRLLEMTLLNFTLF